MALMLRKACQPILDDADLDCYHADIDDNSKHLCLYTPCGKHFAFVHGVRFGKIAPTIAEIEFATELLEQWLKRNKKTIDDYLIAWEAEQRLGKMQTEHALSNNYAFRLVTGNAHVISHRTGRRGYSSVPNGYVVSCPDNSFITFDGNHRIRSWEISKNESAGVKNGYKISLPPTTMKEAIAFYEDWVTLAKARQRLGEIHAELNTCTDGC